MHSYFEGRTCPGPPRAWHLESHALHSCLCLHSANPGWEIMIFKRLRACVCVCVRERLGMCTRVQVFVEKKLDPLELELGAVVSYLKWMPGTEPGPLNSTGLKQ